MLSSVGVLLKLLKFSLVTALSIAVVLFAISNKHAILVALWPFNLSVEVPVYLLCLGILAAGFILGSLFSWLKNLPRNYRERQTLKQFEQLDERVKQLGKDDQEKQTNIVKSASNTVTTDA